MGKKRFVKAKTIKAAASNAVPSKQEDSTDKTSMNDIISPPYSMKYLLEICDHSTILGQCIDAYKRNIAGFGVSLLYKDGDTEETDEMKREWTFIDKELLPFFSFDKSFTDLLELAIEHRERTGNGYLEIIRDGTDKPVEMVNMLPQYMKITKLTEPTEVTYNVNGTAYKRYKKFRRYIQEISTTKVWFKEYGDPRFMNRKTGKFTDQHNGDDEANEVLHLKIGDGAYGIPRWVPHVIHIMGARKAEELNYRYFKQGRHTPMAVLLKNAILSEESEKELVDYAASVEGEDNQHKFLLLQVESNEEDAVVGDARPNVDIELKSLADILQNDALFLEYDEKSRQKVQSAFRLPDIYVGYSRDFNRATADTAREVTEEQVFEPERESLEFIINNILLLPYEFKYVQIDLKKPEISNTEDLTKMIDTIGKYGGIASDDLRDLASHVLGKPLEPFNTDESKIPIVLRQITQQQSFMQQMQPIQKSANNDLVMVLKDLRDSIEEMRGK